MNEASKRKTSNAGIRGRARVRRNARFAAGHGLLPSRGERFARRAGKDAEAAAPPSFAELACWPQWPALSASEQDRVFALTALLASGKALTQVISGRDLRLYAAPFGEALFERALALDETAKGTLPLPPPEELAASGHALARKGLPPVLQAALPAPPAASCASASADGALTAYHTAQAEHLLLGGPPPASYRP
ncbi:hypothetical protein [Novosphingobium beihaiensis]|uniref:Uncharacterized protein n=1 Tax=Novosphingobium beihaiensis TaxID=2930389 RepID=A0ABT0BVM4_9SPHN|nr:hypothetical protein [Novosphingobium beihaiensis]MCJ2189092.1 hypothetical protein [Novosphingobium beihaiensis]